MNLVFLAKPLPPFSPATAPVAETLSTVNIGYRRRFGTQETPHEGKIGPRKTATGAASLVMPHTTPALEKGLKTDGLLSRKPDELSMPRKPRIDQLSHLSKGGERW